MLPRFHSLGFQSCLEILGKRCASVVLHFVPILKSWENGVRSFWPLPSCADAVTGWKYSGGPPWVRAKLGWPVSNCFLFVWGFAVLCRCRDGMEVLGGATLGTRAKTSSRRPVEMGSSPLSPVLRVVSPLEDEIWRQCSPTGVVQDSILVPSGFNWFIIVLNSRCELVESGDSSSSRI